MHEPQEIIKNDNFELANENITMQPYILMLQTDPDDRLLTEEILREMNTEIPLEFLFEFEKFVPFVSNNGKPLLILISERREYPGIEILKQLKANADFSFIPCVILTEMSLREDIIEYYSAGASSVITKPSTLEMTKRKIQTFFTYWLKVAELPGQVVFESN